MYQLFAKVNHSDPYFEYKTTVKTEKELDEWIEHAITAFEGIAWMNIQEGHNATLRTFEYDKKKHTVNKRTLVEYVREGDKVTEKTIFCVDDAKKNT